MNLYACLGKLYLFIIIPWINQGKSDPAIQGWQSAGAAENANDKNFLKWALSILMDLLNPGRKPKEVLEEGGDDNLDTGDKKDDGDVKGNDCLDFTEFLTHFHKFFT